MTQRRALSLFFALILVEFLAQSSWAQPQGKVSETLAESGKVIFEKHCASCHGVDGSGGGPVASTLKTPPADLTRIAERRGGSFPQSEIGSIIDGRSQVASHGSREMPIWGRAFGQPVGGGELGEEVARGSLATLVEYLRSIQR